MSVQELVEFLQSPRADVVRIALENLLPSTLSSAGQSYIFKDNDFQGSRALKKLSIHSTDPWTSQNATIALINLSENDDIRKDLAADNTAVTAYAKKAAASVKTAETKYICMLLSNLAREESTVQTLRGPLLAALVMTSAKSVNTTDEDYDFLSFVFSDFARQDGYSIAKLVPYLYTQLMTGSLNRRKGVAATIKNALFESRIHEPLAMDTPLIETIMLCLQGPEIIDTDDASKLPPVVRNAISPSKKREADVEVQISLVECLLLLSSSQVGRDSLRLKNAYFIIRELHKSSENPKLVELCENFVNMVMRGDPNDSENRVEELDHADNGASEDEEIVEVV